MQFSLFKGIHCAGSYRFVKASMDKPDTASVLYYGVHTLLWCLQQYVDALSTVSDSRKLLSCECRLQLCYHWQVLQLCTDP